MATPVLGSCIIMPARFTTAYSLATLMMADAGSEKLLLLHWSKSPQASYAQFKDSLWFYSLWQTVMITSMMQIQPHEYISQAETSSMRLTKRSMQLATCPAKAHLDVRNLENIPFVYQFLPFRAVAGNWVIDVRDLQLNKHLHVSSRNGMQLIIMQHVLYNMQTEAHKPMCWYVMTTFPHCDSWAAQTHVCLS